MLLPLIYFSLSFVQDSDNFSSFFFPHNKRGWRKSSKALQMNKWYLDSLKTEIEVLHTQQNSVWIKIDKGYIYIYIYLYTI